MNDRTILDVEDDIIKFMRKCKNINCSGKHHNVLREIDSKIKSSYCFFVYKYDKFGIFDSDEALHICEHKLEITLMVDKEKEEIKKLWQMD